jgi:hypothetical protein
MKHSLISLPESVPIILHQRRRRRIPKTRMPIRIRPQPIADVALRGRHTISVSLLRGFAVLRRRA